MRKLVRIVRSAYTPEFHPENVNVQWRRRLPQVIIPQFNLSEDRSNFLKQGEFFIIEEGEEENAMRSFAEGNPGCEVQIYALEASAQCPAAPMVVKKVSADGVLPG